MPHLTGTALIWSIHHVAVVQISGGTVSHSDPIPLLAAYGYDEEGFMNALHLLWHYLPYPRWRIVHQRATSEGAGTSFGKLPTEIVLKIMASTNQLYYPKYQFLSHDFFKLWWKQLRFGSYAILPDGEEIEETFRCFNAHSAEENVPVKLQLKFLWGKQSGNIWRSHITPNPDYWEELYRQSVGRYNDDWPTGSAKTKYRLQRFYSYWPEDPYKLVPCPPYLPSLPDPFSSQRKILLCDVKRI